jgi:predicted amidohydrolase
MRVAVAQFRSGEDKADNLGRLRGLIGQAAADGAQLVITPEASMHSFGEGHESLAPYAEPLGGPFVEGLAADARALGITVVAGMFETVDDDPARAYNTVVAIGPDGGLIGRYRKLHLFDALGWTESKQLAAGPMKLLTFGCGDVTVGVLTCYDLRFPELSRALVDAGATMLALPSAWVAGPHKVDQWTALVHARAIENTVYVAGAAQPPPQYSGHSLVVDPFGVRLTELGDDEGFAVADVTSSRVAEVRERMPSLQHRRFHVVPNDKSR